MKTQSKPVHKRASVRRKRRKPSTAIVKATPPTISEAIEAVLIKGDLTPLTPEQRLEYYRAVCKSLGLNPLTRPFDYIAFAETENAPAKLTLYARRDCGDQLRKIHGISVTRSRREIAEGFCTVEVEVMDQIGKTDTGTGVVWLSDKYGKALVGKQYANAIMRAETKAKRRATLSVCGLGMLDESELDTIENSHALTPGGRLIIEQGSTGSREAAQAVAQDIIAKHKAKLAGTVRETPENVVFAHFHKTQQGVVYLWGALQSIEGHIKSDFLGIRQEVSGYWTIPADQVEPLKELCSYRALFWKKVDALPALRPAEPAVAPAMAILRASTGAQGTADRAEAGSIGAAPPPSSPQSAPHVQPTKQTAATADPGVRQKPPSAPSPPPGFKVGHIIKAVHPKLTKPNKEGKGGGNAYLEVEYGEKKFSCFDNRQMGVNQHLFDLLGMAIGQPADLVIEEKTNNQGRTFKNIVGALRIGDREWLEDGTPAVQRGSMMFDTLPR